MHLNWFQCHRDLISGIYSITIKLVIIKQWIIAFLYYIVNHLLLQEFKRETRFTSKCPANEIINKIEEAAKPMGFDVHKKNYKVSSLNIFVR